MTFISKNDTIFIIIYITRIILKGCVDMKKELTSVLLAALLTLGITACSSSGGGSSQSGDSGSTAESTSAPALKVKTVDEIKAEMKEEAEANGGVIQLNIDAETALDSIFNQWKKEFKELYSDPSYEIQILRKNSYTAKNRIALSNNEILEDDILYVAADDLKSFSDMGIISEIDQSYYGDPSEVFLDAAIEEVTVEGKLYAYPQNYLSYYIIYDKDVFTDPKDLESLDSIIAKAEENNKSFGFNLENFLYLPAFFFASGMEIKYENGVQTADLSSNEAFEAYKSIRDYIKMHHECFRVRAINIDMPILFATSDHFSGFIGAGFDLVTVRNNKSGTLPDKNIGIAKMPTALVNGEQKLLEPSGELICFAVNSRTKFPKTAQAFAAFISSAENKRIIAEKFDANVPIKELENTDELRTVMAQLPYTHRISKTYGYEGCFPGASGLVNDLYYKNGDVTDERLQKGIKKRLIDKVIGGTW